MEDLVKEIKIIIFKQMTGIFKNIHDIKCCKGRKYMMVDSNTRQITKKFTGVSSQF